MTLKDMVNKPFSNVTLKGISLCSLLINFYFTWTNMYTNNLHCYFEELCVPCIVCCAVFSGIGGASARYLALSAVWNVSLVASILDGVHGTKALALAISYSRGREVKTREQYDKHVETVGDEVGREVEAVEE
ncbi:hypothetical protein ACFX13_021500 [Malus domestica]